MFKQVKDYPKYKINQSGQVVNTKTGHSMSWVDNGKGYKMVKLYSEEKPKGRFCLVHRLVMSTFNPISEQMDVNHIDGNKSNNLLQNLEWVTKSNNTRHAHLTGLFKNKLTIEQVQEIKAIKNTEVARVVGERYGVRGSIIWKIWNGYLYNYV